jgi:hypothetical protein
MKTRTAVAVGALAILLGAIPAAADDLTGAQLILCAAEEVTACTADGECESGSPSKFNVPQFIVVDLEDETLSTTEASGENRRTPIRQLTREDGMIVLQGFEMERAFSFNIDEATGMMTAAVARPGLFVGAFGACTPLPVDHD